MYNCLLELSFSALQCFSSLLGWGGPPQELAFIPDYTVRPTGQSVCVCECEWKSLFTSNQSWIEEHGKDCWYDRSVFNQLSWYHFPLLAAATTRPDDARVAGHAVNDQWRDIEHILTAASDLSYTVDMQRLQSEHEHEDTRRGFHTSWTKEIGDWNHRRIKQGWHHLNSEVWHLN